MPFVAPPAPSFAFEPTQSLDSRPYLAAIGSPSLRFAEAIPPPDLTVRPAAGAPPSPEIEAIANIIEPAKPDVAPPEATVAAQPQVAAAEPAKPAAPVKSPPPILPDDTRPKVRAEDFLPFFQFPASGGAAGDVTVVAPVPAAPTAAPLPPSSATYRQQ